MSTLTPTVRSVLATLNRKRWDELARAFSVIMPAAQAAQEQPLLDTLARSPNVHFKQLLLSLTLDELKGACKAHRLPHKSRTIAPLLDALLAARGADSIAPTPLFTGEHKLKLIPEAGDIVQLRHRQWLVQSVELPKTEGDAHLVRLHCLDDDNQGAAQTVLWELELGAQVVQPAAHGLGAIASIDPPRYFAAYLHALKWNSVTATSKTLFHSPFRAGIKLMEHQLSPLKKALELPRANVFIADDVGLGKTIEAGLIARELLLRQRVDFILVVCPASVTLQWRDELEKRFGLYCEVMSREFVGAVRTQRGFKVNPWSTHNRFIISQQLLRRPEYREPLNNLLKERMQKSLLILDEAHNAAPASSAKYAVDSEITKVVRDLAPRFENRLFLSATPHNGHSNSFSALLELLDPQRFTRGVKVTDRAELEPVMVRRLKEDLRVLGRAKFPLRKLVQLKVHGEQELALATMLSEYTRLYRADADSKKKRRASVLVLLNLQKRLLSSTEAFYCTLRAHARGLGLTPDGAQRGNGSLAGGAVLDGLAEPPVDEDDSVLEEQHTQLIEAESERLRQEGLEGLEAGLQAQRATLVQQMLTAANAARMAPDAKVTALIAWIAQHLCPAVGLGGASESASKAERKWKDRRVLIFTEYGDSKRYLLQLIQSACDGTERGHERVMEFHGGMSDAQRAAVQQAFNGSLSEHPVRILIATDAAREGVNLQGHCADLFHFDIPWNPGRLEQRNGRIDRTLQPSDEVRCHYFTYPARKEDRVLETLVHKVDVIQRELGSIGAVLFERINTVLEEGIHDETLELLQQSDAVDARKDTTVRELEQHRKSQRELLSELEECSKLLSESKKIMDFSPGLLRDAINVGLELVVAKGATSAAPALIPRGESSGGVANKSGKAEWELPKLPESWQNTVDSLRPARLPGESFWDFRNKSPLPVVFDAPEVMDSAAAHLHLQHPFVQRLLGRFLSQGFSAHDLSRVTIVRTGRDALVRVLAFGRLSLFGRGAARLHDQLVSVAARWVEGREAELKVFADEADKKAIVLLEEMLAEAPSLEKIPVAVQRKVLNAAPVLFANLWSAIKAEADKRGVEAKVLLEKRGIEESVAMSEILKRQRASIIEATEQNAQLSLSMAGLEGLSKQEQQQWTEDKKSLSERLVKIQTELETEPQQIRELYKVELSRLTPVGLVVLWPETRS
jgi:ERCC4-related helicase